MQRVILQAFEEVDTLSEVIDAFFELWFESAVFGPYFAPTMVFATLLLGFYIYGDGLVLPIAFTLIFGGWALAFVAGVAIGVTTGVLIAALALLLAALYWRMNRG